MTYICTVLFSFFILFIFQVIKHNFNYTENEWRGYYNKQPKEIKIPRYAYILYIISSFIMGLNIIVSLVLTLLGILSIPLEEIKFHPKKENNIPPIFNKIYKFWKYLSETI